MYEKHFGFDMPPFEVTADPRFLYESNCHREALAALKYGIAQRRGFIALVGEVGTGKSTLVRALLESIGSEMQTMLITHTSINREELLRMVMQEVDLPERGQSRVELIRALSDFVLEEAQANRPPPVLIVDEAHNLSINVLEEIRLLTNLESSRGKMLQVILAGQPELDQKLDSPRLRQLKQRIAIHCRLEPLGAQETREYVSHRMGRAGRLAPASLFTDGALTEIWRASRGLPRAINHLCEQTLLSAYALRRERVDQQLVHEAIRDLRLEPAAGIEADPAENMPKSTASREQTVPPTPDVPDVAEEVSESAEDPAAPANHPGSLSTPTLPTSTPDPVAAPRAQETIGGSPLVWPDPKQRTEVGRPKQKRAKKPSRAAGKRWWRSGLFCGLVLAMATLAAFATWRAGLADIGEPWNLASVFGSNPAQGPRLDPVVLENIQPEYPAEGDPGEFAGEVRVWVRLAPDGRVTAARPDEEELAPEIYVQSALTAAKLWRFDPASVSAWPSEDWLPIRLAFAVPEADVGDGSGDAR